MISEESTVWTGSSPRMRGARVPRAACSSCARIIPADAGSTTPFIPLLIVLADHPRGCGEHLCRSGLWSCREGSSPRMRGAHDIQDDLSQMHRIIPADAGSTRRAKVQMMAGRDHPRGCGEHDHLRSPSFGLSGSSPRMRGALRTSSERGRPLGIIPADAGSTVRVYGHVRVCKDHPRGCGKHMGLPAERAVRRGSSPRMRGAPVSAMSINGRPRIIPADAGSTCRPCS